jgi:hypothetical protein
MLDGPVCDIIPVVSLGSVNKIQQGLYLDVKKPVDKQCIICNKRCHPLKAELNIEKDETIQNYISRYNRNLLYWCAVFNKMVEGLPLNTKEYLLRYDTPYSLCSPACFTKYLEGREAEILIYILQEGC